MNRILLCALCAFVLAGCDQAGRPLLPTVESKPSPTIEPTIEPTPLPTATPLEIPPEVEPGAGQPTRVEWPNPAAPIPAGTTAAPAPIRTPIPRQSQRDPWEWFRVDCESRGGNYIPPSTTYGQVLPNGRTDVTGPQCDLPNRRASQ